VLGLSSSAFATAARGCPSANNSCARFRTSGVSTRGCRVQRGAKNALLPPALNFFTYRFMLIGLMPQARTTSAWVHAPFTTNWVVYIRNAFRSLSAWVKTGRVPWK